MRSRIGLPVLVIACLGLLLVGARARDDVLVNEHGNFEQDNDIEVRYDTHDHDHDQDQTTFSHFEFRESQSASEPEHVVAEAQDESDVDSDGSSWVTPQLQDLVQQAADAQLLETKSRVFRSLHARTRRSGRAYSSTEIGPSGSGSSLSSSSNIVTGSAPASGADATLSSSITKQANGGKTLDGAVNLPAGGSGASSPGVINTGESRIHTDREGHHFIVLTNNNVLAQTVPDTAQQILAAAAAQSVAKQILDMARRRAVVQSTVVQEATSKSQVQTQSEQKREQEKVVEQKTSSEDKEKQDEAAKKRLIVTLQDPWVPYGGDYADPKASRVDNLCIVEGMLKGSEGHVATLGPDCRPIGRLTFALIRSGQVGRVDVLPDGRVHVIAGGNPGWLSLYGLAFTVGADKQPDLLDKWAPLANGFRPPTISKIGDLCLASGVLTTSTGSWDKGLIKAPMECYATERLIFNADNHDAISQVDLLPSGELMWQAGGKGHNWVSLDGVAWCVQEGGIALELDAIGGWSSFGKGFRRPKYCMVQGYCVLSGVIQNPKDWTGLIAKLPEACRPAKRSPFAVNSKAKMARIDVYPNGEVRYVDGADSGASFLSLDGVRFLSAQVGLQKSGTSVATQPPPGAVSTVTQPSAASAVKP